MENAGKLLIKGADLFVASLTGFVTEAGPLLVVLR